MEIHRENLDIPLVGSNGMQEYVAYQVMTGEVFSPEREQKILRMSDEFYEGHRQAMKRLGLFDLIYGEPEDIPDTIGEKEIVEYLKNCVKEKVVDAKGIKAFWENIVLEWNKTNQIDKFDSWEEISDFYNQSRKKISMFREDIHPPAIR